MARHLETLFSPERPTPLRGGFEVHIVEYHHIDIEHRNDGWRPINLMVNFDDSPEARSTFSAARHAFTSARYSSYVFDGDDGVSRLRLHLEGMTFDSLDVVIFVGKNADDVTRLSLQGIVDAATTDSPGLLVVVDHDCRRLMPVKGISGFIQGASLTSPASAMSVFLVIASLSAPHTIICVDHDEVLASLGTAEQPAVMVEAIWLRAQRQLVYTGPQDALAIRQANVIACNIVAASLGIAEVRELTKVVKEQANLDCSISYQAPVDALTTPHLHSGVALIPMICRSAGVDHC